MFLCTFCVETPSKKCIEIISLYFCNPSADIRSEDVVCSVPSGTAEKIKSGLTIRESPLCLCAYALLGLWLSGGQAPGSGIGSCASQQGHLQLTLQLLHLQSQRRKTRYAWSYFGCLSYKQSSQHNAQLFVPPSKSP